MTDRVDAYPLTWPPGRPRTPANRRRRAAFCAGERSVNDIGVSRVMKRALTVAQALARVTGELDRLGARRVVISTNVRLRLDGRPRSGEAAPEDPGVSVYFHLEGRPHCLPCDAWDRVADNLAAVAKHIEATRGIARWGVGSLEQMFTGFPALSASTSRPWRQVLGVSSLADLATAELAYRNLARVNHPDAGGSHDAMAELTAAIAEARRELAPARLRP